MYRKVETLVDENLTDFNGLPNWNPIYTLFKNGIGPIQAQADLQAPSTGGPGTDKRAKREDMDSKANYIRKRLAALAMNTDNEGLAADMAFTDSDQRNASEESAVTKAKLVHGRAVTHATALAGAGYNVDSGKTGALAAAIEVFETAMPLPELAIEAHAQVTNAFDPLFNAQDLVLDRLRLLADLLQGEDVELFELWAAASKIDATATRKIPLRGKAKRGPDGLQVVAHAKFRLVELNIIVESTLKGNYRFDSVPEGYYNLEVRCPGYQPFNVFVNIVTGVGLKLDMMLVPL